jgi:hypothetical protein
VTKSSIPDDETRSGFRSGEGSESVMQHLMSARRRRQKARSGFAESHPPTQPAEDGDDVDVNLP